MTPNQLKTTLEQKLKDSNPALYSKLKAENRLAEVLQPIIGRMVESLEDARSLAIEAATTQGNPVYVNDPTLRTQTLNSQFKAAEEVALQQAIEELDALEAA